ncbi:hypothetical protein Tco_0910888 [Tanacetum coccineum]|uniref:Uncharacterized protein n=1 Tax=Tanacetum coccineum TaxID=301880 RepID=A0ABQ5CXC2_9ASTR
MKQFESSLAICIFHGLYCLSDGCQKVRFYMGNFHTEDPQYGKCMSYSLQVFEDPAHPKLRSTELSKALFKWILKIFAKKEFQDEFLGMNSLYFWGLQVKHSMCFPPPIEAHKSLGNEEEGEDVDCISLQVTPKDSPFHLEAFSDSDYAGAQTMIEDNFKWMSLYWKKISTDTLQGTATSQGTAEIQRTADFQGTAEPHDAASIPKSPNDYTPKDASQTLRKEANRSNRRKCLQSIGEEKEEGNLCLIEHYGQDDFTAEPFFDFVDKDVDKGAGDLERKSDETEEINIEKEEASNVKSGDTEELDLETTQSTARQSTITPRTLNFEDEAGPSSPPRPTQVMESEEQLKVDEVLAAISRPRGLSIPGPIQSQPQQPTQGTDTQGTDPKDKGKGILVEEPKKKKMTLQQIRALETMNDEEVARKTQAEWDAEEERKRFEELKKAKPKTTLRVKPTSLAQERNQMMHFLKGQGYKNLQKLKYPQMKELYEQSSRHLLTDSFKDLFQWIQRKEREMLKEREAKKRLSRKGKL